MARCAICGTTVDVHVTRHCPNCAEARERAMGYRPQLRGASRGVGRMIGIALGILLVLALLGGGAVLAIGWIQS